MTLRRVHLVGIGGVGLSAIAKILLSRGIAVSGSDLRLSALTDELQELGAMINLGHRAENVGDVDLVLMTSAAHQDNPEVREARRRGIRVVKRIDFFPELVRGDKVIAIAGTHGKTTTTGMISAILIGAGLDPSVVVGGLIPELNGNARAGSGEYFVIEADEYDRAFLGLTPWVAVVTTIEMEHPDVYDDVTQVADAFREFMQRVAPQGLLVGCGDSEQIREEMKNISGTRSTQYGLDSGNPFWADDIRPNQHGGNDFVMKKFDAPTHHYEPLGEFSLSIPGKHNVSNGLAALTVAFQLGIDLKIAREMLLNFRGAARRFEIKGEFNGITIIDDYAHHPTEIRATLRAARERFPGRGLWAVFQPHTFSRTRLMRDELAAALGDAEHVIVTEIFAARETDSLGVSGSDIVSRMNHPDARFIPELDGVAAFLSRHARPGDLVITLGAGDVNRVGTRLARVGGSDAGTI